MHEKLQRLPGKRERFGYNVADQESTFVEQVLY